MVMLQEEEYSIYQVRSKIKQLMSERQSEVSLVEFITAGRRSRPEEVRMMLLTTVHQHSREARQCY
jgi:hypothetical protein